MTLRRDFLCLTVSAVAAKTVLPMAAKAQVRHLAAPSEHPDADLIALDLTLDEAMAAEQAVWDANAGDNWTEEGEEHANVMMARTSAIIRQIEAVRALSIDGLKVKMKALVWCHSGRLPDLDFFCAQKSPATDVRLVMEILADLDAIPGSTVA